MSAVSRALLFLVSCVFTDNFVFARLLGSSRLFDKSRRVELALGTGIAVTAAMGVVSALAWLANRFVLVPLGGEYLQTVVFALIVGLVALIAERAVAKHSPELREALGDSAPLVAANAAVLGAALLNLEGGVGLGMAVVQGLLGGVGFLVALVLMAGVQERLAASKIPAPMKGLPISLVAASLVAMAFMGFAGIG